MTDIFNHVNWGPEIGTLNSPFFGQSTSVVSQRTGTWSLWRHGNPKSAVYTSICLISAVEDNPEREMCGEIPWEPVSRRIRFCAR